VRPEGRQRRRRQLDGSWHCWAKSGGLSFSSPRRCTDARTRAVQNWRRAPTWHGTGRQPWVLAGLEMPRDLGTVTLGSYRMDVMAPCHSRWNGQRNDTATGKQKIPIKKWIF
jgi:hypothetical protein